MAVSEDGADEPDQHGFNTASAHDDGSGSGARNGRHPVPASDHFAAELPENIDMANLTAQTVVASAGERVTSACGTEGLDVTSRATVLRQQSSSTLVPQRDVRPHISDEEDTSSNNTVSSSEAAVAETDIQRTMDSNDSLSLSSAPSLSLGSLSQFESGSASHLVTASVPLQESLEGFEVYSSKDAEESRSVELSTATSLTDDSKQPIHHFGERSISSEGQRDTSGYRSDSVSSLFKSGKRHQNQAVQSKDTCRQKTLASTRAADYSGLHLSETGINAIKCESGTRQNPFYPSYSGLPKRLESFPERFRLGDDVSVNRDLLALAGFFYSVVLGHGTVTCFHCGCSPRVWGDGRDPKTEHRMLSPNCRALPLFWD